MPISDVQNLKEAVANNVLEGLPVDQSLLEMLEAAAHDSSITVTELLKQFVG